MHAARTLSYISRDRHSVDEARLDKAPPTSVCVRRRRIRRKVGRASHGSALPPLSDASGVRLDRHRNSHDDRSKNSRSCWRIRRTGYPLFRGERPGSTAASTSKCIRIERGVGTRFSFSGVGDSRAGLRFGDLACEPDTCLLDPYSTVGGCWHRFRASDACFELKQRANYVSWINFGASVAGGLVGWTLLTLGYGVTSWAAAQLSSALFTFYFSAIHSDVVLSKVRLCASESRALLKTWYPLLPGAALSAAIPVITPYVLWQTGGAQAAGIFAVASQFAGVVALLTGALATAWLPYFQSKVGQQIEWAPTYRRLLHGHLIVGATVCLVVLLLAEDALRWLSADSYASAQKAIYPLVVANVLASVWSFLLPGTYYAGHTATVSWTH